LQGDSMICSLPEEQMLMVVHRFSCLRKFISQNLTKLIGVQ